MPIHAPIEEATTVEFRMVRDIARASGTLTTRNSWRSRGGAARKHSDSTVLIVLELAHFCTLWRVNAIFVKFWMLRNAKKC